MEAPVSPPFPLQDAAPKSPWLSRLQRKTARRALERTQMRRVPFDRTTSAASGLALLARRDREPADVAAAAPPPPAGVK